MFHARKPWEHSRESPSLRSPSKGLKIVPSKGVVQGEVGFSWIKEMKGSLGGTSAR